MTSHEQYIDIQRRLMRLYETGNELEPAQLERALDGLMGATRQMVRTRRREVSTPITPPGTPPLGKPPEGSLPSDGALLKEGIGKLNGINYIIIIFIILL